MDQEIVYLDHNATTPLLPEVVDAMLPFLREHFGNPSSNHALGRTARDAVERARAQVAELLGCAPVEVLFTGGGTEANNLAIRGAVEARGDRTVVVHSAVEHPAVSAPCARLAQQGCTVRVLPVDGTGRVNLDDARGLVRPDTALLSVMHAQNEVGTLQPLPELSALAHAVGATVHCDAAQSVGKVSVNVDALGVDLLTVAGHKLYGPKGVGALYVRAGTPLRPLVVGAGHERGLRPGTENVASIVGLGVAAGRAAADLAAEQARLEALRERLWVGLQAAVPGVVLLGHRQHRLPNTLSVSFPGVAGADVLRHAPAVAASTGSACHADGGSEVLRAMRVAPEVGRGAVRLTLGRLTALPEVERALALLRSAFLAARDAGLH